LQRNPGQNDPEAQGLIGAPLRLRLANFVTLAVTISDAVTRPW
jgi:hypothetical protein